MKKKPSKQAGIPTKNESNKGDSKGGISIDKDYLQSLKNLYAKGVKKNQQYELFKSLFIKYLDNKKLIGKEIQFSIEKEMREVMNKKDYNLTRPTFFRYKSKFTEEVFNVWSNKRKLEAEERHEAQKKIISKKIESPGTKEAINLDSLKRDIEKTFAINGSKFKSGQSIGSKRGGESTKKKFI